MSLSVFAISYHRNFPFLQSFKKKKKANRKQKGKKENLFTIDVLKKSERLALTLPTSTPVHLLLQTAAGGRELLPSLSPPGNINLS